MSGGGKTSTQTSTQTRTGTRNSETGRAGYAFQGAVAPEGWEDAWNALKPGSSGLTDDQTAALASLRGNVGRGVGALTNPATFFYEASQRAPVTLGGALADVTAAPVTAGTVSANTIGAGTVSADTIGAERVNGQTAADLMGLYKNPFEDQVVSGALRDLERKYNLAQTAAGSRQQAAGAFGGSASALENALIADDYFGTVGDTAAGLRSRGFETAVGAGAQDAARMLQAGGMNQSTAQTAAQANQEAALRAGGMNQSAALTAGQANQDAWLRAGIQNQNNLTQRQMFDVDATYRGREQQTAAARDWANTVSTALGIDNATAMALMGAGGVGQAQSLAWLNGGLPLFGRETGEVGWGWGNEDYDETSTGTSTTKQSGGGFGSILSGLGALAAGLGGLGWAPFGAAGGAAGGAAAGGGNLVAGGYVPKW